MSVKGMLRIRFAPGLSAERQEHLRRALSAERRDSESFDGYRRGVKRFYRLPSPMGALFVKVRQFDSLGRRLRNTLGATKDEREFDNLLALGRLGIPCPAALAVARVGSVLTAETRLAQEFVEALPLKCLLLESGVAERSAVLDGLVGFLGLLQERGVVHKDLHWSNLLVRHGAAGHEFLLIDALHVRLLGRRADTEFEACLDWLVGYAMYEQCSPEIVGELLDRLRRPAMADAGARQGRARRLADQLVLRDQRKRLVPSPPGP